MDPYRSVKLYENNRINIINPKYFKTLDVPDFEGLTVLNILSRYKMFLKDLFIS